MATPAQVQLRSLNGYALTGYQAPISLRGLNGYALVDSAVRKPSLTGSAQTAIVTALNREYGLALKVEQLTFGVPRALSGGDFNSEIALTAKPSSGYSGSKTFRYNRLDVAAVVTATVDDSKVKAMAGAADTLAYLALINSTFSLNLTAADLDNQAVVDDGETVQVTVKAASASLLYQGSQVLTLRYLPHISKAFTTNLLTGF